VGVDGSRHLCLYLIGDDGKSSVSDFCHDILYFSKDGIVDGNVEFGDDGVKSINGIELGVVKSIIGIELGVVKSIIDSIELILHSCDSIELILHSLHDGIKPVLDLSRSGLLGSLELSRSGLLGRQDIIVVVE